MNGHQILLNAHKVQISTVVIEFFLHLMSTRMTKNGTMLYLSGFFVCFFQINPKNSPEKD
jgi:hypothetical protein